ncbi:MAG: hypothetical protein U0228_26015 [Myxococcaceae bacterium]
MLALALTLALSQAPPPLVESTPAPETFTGFADFVDKHLLTLSADGSVRQRTRSFRLSDEDFPSAFSLVPESAVLAQEAQRDFLLARTFDVTSTVLLGASTAAALAATLVPGVLIPLLAASVVGLGVALVLALIALPLAHAAQAKFLDAISAHNHGLLEFRPASGPELQLQRGGLTVSF